MAVAIVLAGLPENRWGTVMVVETSWRDSSSAVCRVRQSSEEASGLGWGNSGCMNLIISGWWASGLAR